MEDELERLSRVPDMIRFKCRYYEKALEGGNEKSLNAMKPDGFPEEIQALYDYAHGKSERVGADEKSRLI